MRRIAKQVACLSPRLELTDIAGRKKAAATREQRNARPPRAAKIFSCTLPKMAYTAGLLSFYQSAAEGIASSEFTLAAVKLARDRSDFNNHDVREVRLLCLRRWRPDAQPGCADRTIPSGVPRPAPRRARAAALDLP
jgi:hypothetical protein